MADSDRGIILRPNIKKFVIIGFVMSVFSVPLLYLTEARLIPLTELFFFIPFIIIGSLFLLSFFSQYVYVKDGSIVIESMLSVLLRHKFQSKINVKDIISLRYVTRDLNMGEYLEVQTSSNKIQISNSFFSSNDFKLLISLLSSMTFLSCENIDANKGPYTIWHLVGIMLAAWVLTIIFPAK